MKNRSKDCIKYQKINDEDSPIKAIVITKRHYRLNESQGE